MPTCRMIQMDLQKSAISRAIFKTRELAMRAEVHETPTGGVLPVMTALGWRVLVPERRDRRFDAA